MFPALWQITAALGEGKADAIAAWALCLVLIGLLQLAYAAYLVQLPDWSSVWVVTVMMLVMTTLYATLMALSWLSNGQHRLLLLLDLSGLVIRNKVTGWTFIMVSICALYAYFSGQCSSAWRARS
jgi:hypothetical protein